MFLIPVDITELTKSLKFFEQFGPTWRCNHFSKVAEIKNEKNFTIKVFVTIKTTDE